MPSKLKIWWSRVCGTDRYKEEKMPLIPIMIVRRNNELTPCYMEWQYEDKWRLRIMAGEGEDQNDPALLSDMIVTWWPKSKEKSGTEGEVTSKKIGIVMLRPQKKAACHCSLHNSVEVTV